MTTIMMKVLFQAMAMQDDSETDHDMSELCEAESSCETMDSSELEQAAEAMEDLLTAEVEPMLQSRAVQALLS